jgi:hypothetical protein
MKIFIEIKSFVHEKMCFDLLLNNDTRMPFFQMIWNFGMFKMHLKKFWKKFKNVTSFVSFEQNMKIN